MKMIILTTVASAFAASIQGFPDYEPFNYPSGAVLYGQVNPDGLKWDAAGPSGQNITVQALSLSVPGLAPSVGNQIVLLGLTGPSGRFPIGPVTSSGAVYFSFAMRVASLTGLTFTGDYLAGFNDAAGPATATPTVVGTRVLTRQLAALPGYNVGLGTDLAGGEKWDTRVFGPNDTVFIVGCYTFLAGAPDQVSMWVNPDPATFGAAAPPTAPLVTTVASDLKQIVSFVFFQRPQGAQPEATISDELRIGATWASVTPTGGPPNDQCDGAIDLPCGSSFSMDTSSATSNNDPVPTCQQSFGKGVWFTHKPTQDGPVTVSTCGSDFDTVLQVYTGQCGLTSLIPVSGACNDNGGPGCPGALQASVMFDGKAGTTYYILIGGLRALSGKLVVTILDTVPPQIICPNDITANTDAGQCSKSNVTFNVTATDNCGLETVICTPPSGSTFAKGITQVTCRALDTAGNGNTCSFTVTIRDVQAPTIACPNNITANTDANKCSKSNVTFTVTATDNCPGVTVACNPPSGSTFPKGVTTVNCTATDAAANTAACSFTVTIRDVQPPQIACPTNIAVTATSGSGAVVNYPPPTATDNCDSPVPVTCNPPSGSTFPIGTTAVLCTATDTSANSASCTFRVTVRPPADIETDLFSNSVAVVELCLPDGTTQTLSLSGATTVEVSIGPAGQCSDTDGDGRDQARTVMTQLDLMGVSPVFGPVIMKLRDPSQHPGFPTVGEIEELSNANPGILDVPPFEPTGQGDSFFDIFFEIHVGGQIYHNHQPKHMRTVINHKPPGPGQTYESPEPIELFDENERPTGLFLCKTRHTPNPPPPEIDHFSNSVANVTLCLPGGAQEQVTLAGPTTVEVFIGPNGQCSDTDNDGLDQAVTRMTQLDLSGMSSMGPVTMRLRDPGSDPFRISGGEMEEQANPTPGILDIPPFRPTGLCNSFFDVFFEITVGGQAYHNHQAKRMQTVLDHKPPGQGTVYQGPDNIELFDANDRPTGILLCATRHRPQPPVEIDTFDYSLGNLELIGPNGTETVSVSGSTRVAVYFEGNAEGTANDDNGNGRDEVRTEMLALNLMGVSPTLGPIHVSLNPNIPSIGQMEEVANATPGILDIAPFTPSGAANSFFDIFFKVEVAGQTFYTTVPKRMSSRITHKPPGPGDQYESPTQIPLVDANGNPTGYSLGATRHRPRPPVEIDTFDFSFGDFELVGPNGTEVVPVSGPTRVAVYFEGTAEGTANDDNGNGRDEVRTEMLQLDLHGVSPNLGPIHISLNPAIPSLGQMEETANNTPGILDIPPFRPVGTADSFFDIFLQVEVAGQTFHTAVPKRMSSLITHKPPGPNDQYESPTQIPLLDANGNPTGYFVGASRHRPRPPVEIDEFDYSLGNLELIGPNATETLSVSGSTRVAVYFEGSTEGSAHDDDNNGRDEVRTEMVALNLNGVSPSLGPVHVTLNPNLPSFGQMEEVANNTPGTLDIPPFTTTGSADSFFDIFFEVEVVGQRFYTTVPKRMSSRITHKPPGPSDQYESPTRIPLVDANGNPTGYFLGATRHRPKPPVEIDEFPFSLGNLELIGPNGRETVSVSGPTRVAVYFEGATEGSANDDDGNGREEVRTEMLQLDLHGMSPSLGPVHVSLNPSIPSLGQIEESANNTPGTLDIPPFTVTGSADSFFDIFLKVEVAGQTFYTGVPKRMSSRITHKPPGPGDVYQAPAEIPLLDPFGNPTGYFLGATRHRPNPPVEVDQFDYSVGNLELIGPNGTETLSVSGQTRVTVHFEGNTDGTANDDDGNGREEVATEMVALNLTGLSPTLGPVQISLNPNIPSLGQIEEVANNTPGILDIPPFAAAGSADSFFDIFFKVEVAGQTFYTTVPKRMSSRITHKPPGPNDQYESPTRIPLVDANGNPTGYFLGATRHRPQPPVEVDTFNLSVGQLELIGPNGTETVSVSGPTRVAVYFEGAADGTANDDNGNGRDEVRTEMLQLDLSGVSSSFGPIHISLNPTVPSLGQMEEVANNTPGILDIPPFAATGAADSLFDIFFKVEVAGQTFYTRVAKRMSGRITHKPPGPYDIYEGPQTIPLVDSAGHPTGFFIGATRHRPSPPIEVDTFNFSLARVQIQLPDGTGAPAGQPLVVNLAGPTTIHVFVPPDGTASDTDGDGRDQVQTEMVQLDLHGNSALGPVHVTLDPNHQSLGEIEERVNNMHGVLDLPPFAPAGSADSFFDVWFRVEVAGLVLHADQSAHMASVITHKPPGPGETYIRAIPDPIPLLDDSGALVAWLLHPDHTPNPPVEIDRFDYSLAQVTLSVPGRPQENVTLGGPATVRVNIPPSGAAADTDGDGLDQVPTEMTQLTLQGNSSMGPILIRLDPNKRSFGEIEERVNNTPGVLDVPPFTAAGTADSFFDIWTEISVGGNQFYTAAPLRMSSVITHKPPGPGDRYINPFTTPVELISSNGQPTGIFLVNEVHTPNPPPEIDSFENTTSTLEVALPDGTSEVVTLSGPTIVQVMVPPSGAAADTDGNGLDQVPSEIIQMDLTGTSPALGLVKMRLRPADKAPFRRSLGQIEELVNNTPGTLDVPPFTVTGQASSFFEVFFEVDVGGVTLHNDTAKRMRTIISHKPPETGARYEDPTVIELFDENDRPTGIVIRRTTHTPNPPPPPEIDHFPNTSATVELQLPSGQIEQIALSGPSTAQVYVGPSGQASDTDGDGLDDVVSELVQLDLTGVSPTLGPVSLRLRDPSESPYRRSMGQIEEQANNTPGILDIPPFRPTGLADSFFDVYFQIEVAGTVLHNNTPKRMQSVIRHKPPGPGDTYEAPQAIDLFDQNNQPTGVRLLRTTHTPNPTNEIDTFNYSLAQVQIQLVGGPTATVNLAGPTVVQVAIPPNGAASDTDADGRDQVPTEMLSLNLTGNSPMGPVLVRLDPNRPTRGEIEEQVNNTPGVLDLPPFTPTGRADSFFDVFAEVVLNGQVLTMGSPLHLQAVISHKPPGPGEQYSPPAQQTIPLLNAAGGVVAYLIHSAHIPNPPPEIDAFEQVLAEVELALPNGTTELVTLSGTTTVQVMIPPDGTASDTDGNGRDQVPTEIVQMQLTGTSPTLGPVVMRRRDPSRPPYRRSTGQIEELVNNTPGKLDLPPFTATGQADSFFDVFFEIQVAGRLLHNEQPKHMHSVIARKPPEPGATFEDPTLIELFDENGNPTGVRVRRAAQTPNPPMPEIDYFRNSTATVELTTPNGGEVVTLNGATIVHVRVGPNGEASDTDGNGRDQVQSELVSMQLTGQSKMFGPIVMRLRDPGRHPGRRSLGQIEELANNTPGILDVPPFTPTGQADSFFDVFFEIVVGGELVFHNDVAKRMHAVISHKPPGPESTYEDPTVIELLDENDRPAGVQVGKATQTPNPPVEIDHFPRSVAQLVLQHPTGLPEDIRLSGPTTVMVDIPPNGQAADLDGDGSDQVNAEMTEMSLMGQSSLGPINVRLDPTRRSLGQIEELNNRTPGILDLPPFAPTGTAMSFFDVFVEIQVGNRVVHTAQPIHMQSTIRHKPPAPGDVYVNPSPEPIELLDPQGNPTGFRLLREVQAPNPKLRPEISFNRLRIDWSPVGDLPGKLEIATQVTGPWNEVPDAQPGYLLPLDGQVRFVRVRY